MTLLTLADFNFRGTRPPYNGLGEYLVSMEGWEDGVQMRRASRRIPQNHGAYDVPGFMEERTVRFTANVYTHNAVELGRRGRRFTTVLAQGTSRWVDIELDGRTLGGMAGLGAAEPTWRRVPGRLAWARASMELLFADPRRYGELVPIPTAVSGTPFQVYQYGDFPATPTFTIEGSMPGGYVLNMEAGRQFRVNAPLVSGHPHVIEMEFGSLSIDGVVTAGVTPRADTWAIPPGDQPVHSLVPLTTGQATIKTTVRDTN